MNAVVALASGAEALMAFGLLVLGVVIGVAACWSRRHTPLMERQETKR